MFQLIHGFYADTVEIDNINNDNYKDFISDRDYYHGHPYNGPYSAIIDNKLWMPFMLHNHAGHIPRSFFFKDINGFLSLTGCGGGHLRV